VLPTSVMTKMTKTARTARLLSAGQLKRDHADAQSRDLATSCPTCSSYSSLSTFRPTRLDPTG
jgi:hypothetical protein